MVNTKQILDDNKVPILINIVVLLASAIIGSLQGFFGFLLPFGLLVFCILEIILVYYVITIPTLKLLNPATRNDRVYSMERLKEYELTSDIKEVWVITASLNLAFGKDQFGSAIDTNIARGVKYRFYINNGEDAIARERAAKMLDRYNGQKEFFKIFLIPDDLPFIDQHTDYDLFFFKNSPDIKGFIGSTINNRREYSMTTEDLAIKIKVFIDRLKLDSWDGSP